MLTKYPLQRQMDNEGRLIDEQQADKWPIELLREMYTLMIKIRTFDRQAIHLQRQGRLGTYAPFEGQEAAQIGSILGLDKRDWMFPTYREQGAMIAFGASMENIYLYWNGHVEGPVMSKELNIFPPAVPIATQIPHAAGAAWAQKYQGSNQIVMTYFGDGATSEGDFHEGLNFASVYQLPVVLFNQNNGYAISVPTHQQMNSKTIAQKGVAYDIPSVRVDGNDVLAVYEVTMQAIEAARSGKGPTLIEAVTWRKGAHTTADDPSKYREEHEGATFADPIERFEKFLKHYGFWNEEWAVQVQEQATIQVQEAVQRMENYRQPTIDDLFDYVYHTLPPHLEEQKLQCQAEKTEEES